MRPVVARVEHGLKKVIGFNPYRAFSRVQP